MTEGDYSMGTSKVKIVSIAMALVLMLALVVGCSKATLSPISIYDKEDLLEISVEDVGKYHGDVCPCVVVAFRATQLAISELWSDEIPHRSDFRIITTSPTAGTQDTFDFITRAKTGMKRKGDFKVELPEGTSIKKTTKDNYVFTFVRKSTNEQIKIWVKGEVFPPRLFELRTKVKFSEPTPATPEEKQAFKWAKERLKATFMRLPMHGLFEFEKR